MRNSDLITTTGRVRSIHPESAMGDIAEAFKVKLTGLNASSQSIETLSHWCVFHRKKAKDLVKVFERELQGAAGKRKLVFLYLANDVIQNSRKKGREWVDALWPILGWAMKHALRNSSDEKTMRQCEKLVNVWQDRKIFGSRSLSGWLDPGAGGDDANGTANGDVAAKNAAKAEPAHGRNRDVPAFARRREERLDAVPSALTGKHAELAKALETVETASAALEKATSACETDLVPAHIADDVVDTCPEGEEERCKQRLQAAESALAAKRAALEESSKARAEAARLAKEVFEACEAAATAEAAELDESASVAVKVATLRMKATKNAARAMAAAAASEGAGSKNPKPVPKPEPTPAPVAEEEPYVPEGAGDDEEYVPMEAGGGEQDDLQALLSTLQEAAKDPEVFHNMLAALPAEQREMVEKAMAD